jgi:hypothetical protein
MSRDKKAAPPRPATVGWLERITGFWRKRAPTPPMLSHVVGKSGSRRPRNAAPGRADSARMLSALKGLLDRHAASRSVLVHLSLVEQALEHRGVQALEDVPADVLGRALTQLETLVSDWSEASVAALRAQLKAAMAKPGRVDVPRRGPGAKKSTDFDNSRLMVNEASVSTFMEARARWEGSLTGGR